MNRREPQASFSILTTVYELTAVAYFEQTRDSILGQTYRHFEWLVLAHGPITDALRAVLVLLSNEAQCRVEYLGENLGPMGGMLYCLERASGEYIVPIDADDLVHPDALAVLSEYITKTGDRPGFVFSDEDHLVNGQHVWPVCRHGFDPVLLLASSYIWHLCAFRRDAAIRLGVYTDLSCEWCHDWDTALRFYRANETFVHAPRVLYHWRHHASSSTNQARPVSGSLQSQRAVLQRHVDLHATPELFEVAEFPLFRGLPEWHIARHHTSPSVVELTVHGSKSASVAESVCAALRTTDYPISTIRILGTHLETGDRQRIEECFRPHGGGSVIEEAFESANVLRAQLASSPAEYFVYVTDRIHIETAGWLWSCDSLFKLHEDVDLLGGRILDMERRVVAGAEVFGFGGVVNCPDAGRSETDAGYFAQALKPRTCSAPYSELFIVRKPLIVDGIDSLPNGSTVEHLALWLAGFAASTGRRVAFTPLLTAVFARTAYKRLRLGAVEEAVFLQRYGAMMPDTQAYPRQMKWSAGHAFQMVE